MLLDDNSDLLAWLHGVCLFFSSLLCVQWDDTICLSDFCNLKCYLWMLRFVLFSIVMKRGEEKNVHEVVGCVVRPVYRFSLLVPFACVSLFFFFRLVKSVISGTIDWANSIEMTNEWFVSIDRKHTYTQTHIRDNNEVHKEREYGLTSIIRKADQCGVANARARATTQLMATN